MLITMARFLCGHLGAAACLQEILRGGSVSVFDSSRSADDLTLPRSKPCTPSQEFNAGCIRGAYNIPVGVDRDVAESMPLIDTFLREHGGLEADYIVAHW